MDKGNYPQDPKPVMEIPNFLTDEECDELIKLYNQKEAAPQKDDEYWGGRIRFLYKEDVGEHLRHKLYNVRVTMSRQHFGEYMYSAQGEPIQLVMWPKGYKMPPHSDYGVVNEYPHREFASVIYLNDDYAGGELVLPKERIKLKPKRGTLLTFRGGKVWHGVAEIKSGTRYTCICWYSVEPK